MKFSTARKITVGAAFVLVIVGLLFNTGTGTLSSFGWQQIAAICPLGVVEGFLANKTIFARALVVLGITLLFVAVFGKVFCSWLCPVPSLKELVESLKKRIAKGTKRSAKPEKLSNSDEGVASKEPLLHAGAQKDAVQESTLLAGAQADTAEEPLLRAEAQAVAQEVTLTDAKESEISKPLSDKDKATLRAGACSDCSSCAQKRKKLDSRHIVLGGTLLSAALFGFPVFCLICPIGLTFGTIIIFWQWIGFNDISFSLLIYPAILIVELVFLRKWCMRFCPLGALLSLMSLTNRFFKPQVDASKCLRSQGIACTICVDSCPEELDPHFAQGMHECSKCGVCIEKCPTQAISMKFLIRKTPKRELAD